jgi:hypothetical protein
MNVRNNAIEKARGLYGTYLSNLTDEQLLAGNVGDAYTRLSVAIEKAAKARAAQDFIVEKQKQVLTLEQEIAKEREKLEKRKLEIQKEGTTVTQTSMGAVGQILTVQEKLNVAEAGFIARTKDKTAAIKVLNTEMNALSQTYEDNADNVNTNTTKKTKAVEAKKPVLESIKEETAELERQIQAYKNLKFAMMGQGTIMPEKEKEKDLTNLKLNTQGNSALNQIMMQQNQIEEQRLANMELANNLTNTAMNSLNGLANAMMNGQNLGVALGDMFKRLAIDIALAAAKAAIFQAILSAVSGGTASGAGGGGFFKMFGKMLGFAEGGTVTGPRSGYPVMLHGTEHIVRPDQMRSIIASASQMGGGNSRVVVEGRISGNDIFISQKRTSSFRALTT